MKLRILIFGALVMVSVLPVGILAYWQQQTAIDNEFNVVENQHKVIAKNLTIALERYARDVRAAFQLTTDNLHNTIKINGLDQLLIGLHFRHVCSIDANGLIQKLQCALVCPQVQQFPAAVLLSLKDTLQAANNNKGEIVFSNIVPNPKGQPAIYLLKVMQNGNIAIGEIEPSYLVELQTAVAFGEKGHAAIVDKIGRVIAHPLKDWMKSMKDLSKISVVQKMMHGESGVIRFYSPAVKANMVAGFNVVPNVGWGVMVPQPQAEIYLQARSISKAALAIALLGFIVASILSWWLSGFISNPMQLIAEAARAVATGDFSSKVSISSKLRPREIQELASSFNQMIDDIERTNNDLTNITLEAINSNNHKSEFLSSMSHELRTPMNGILGFSELLENNSEEPLSETQSGYVQHITNSGNHLLYLIDQVLHLSKIESDTMEFDFEEFMPSDVIVECMEIMRSLALEKGVTMHGNRGEINGINVDRARFKQVALNLMSNALKYNKVGGELNFGCHRSDNGNIRIFFSDSGEGIPENRQGELFQPFNRLGRESSEIEGTGVGLSITKRLVEAMGGEIGFESTPGVGSNFWVEFPENAVKPVIDEKKSIAKFPLRTNQDDKLRGSILYIEDNPGNLKLVREIISRHTEMNFLFAHDAENGIELAIEHSPDIILMDINLPGMDGITALASIQADERTANIPVIALSANALPEQITKTMAAGFDHYLTKPINMKGLIDSIRNIA